MPKTKKLTSGGAESVTAVPVLNPIRNATEPVVSVIVSALNDRSFIAEVIGQAANVHPQTEVIVVALGSTDGTSEIARQMGANVIYEPAYLDRHQGRGIGAFAAKGEILLFINGNFVIPSEKLATFVQEVGNGTDLALNRYSGNINKKTVQNAVLSRYAVNALFRRYDLSGSSMSIVPFALRRSALNVIGPENLSVPPKAQIMALLNGLRVAAVSYVSLGRNPSNRLHPTRKPDKTVVLGDHLEAIYQMLRISGPRGGYSDLGRQREKAGLK